VAASWNPGEVPLTPGQIYYLEVSHPTGFNPVKFTVGSNAYPDGDAFMSGGRQPGVDLHMQVVEYEVPPQFATIERSPASFTRTIQQGGGLPNDTFTIRNSGSGTLSYTITDTASWLSVSPTSGTSTGEVDPITITYSVASLPPGSYQATITIMAAATNSPQTIAVNLTVETVPLIVRSPASLSTECYLGKDASARTFSVSNGGGGTLNYSITSNRTWMSVHPASGSSTGEADNIGVEFATASLAVGVHTGTITIASGDAGNSPQTVEVSVTVYASGDADRDGDVDLSDFAMFQACFNGPNRPAQLVVECAPMDNDGDGDVDLVDFASFQACFNGPNRPSACQ